MLDEGCLVYVPQRQRFREAFVMVWQEGLRRLAEDGELTGRHWRVLAFLMAKLDYENYIHLAQADIARGVRIDKADVSRAIRDFVERGIVVQGPRVGKSYTYRMSLDLGWKGRVKSFQDERRRRLKLVPGGKSAPGRRIAAKPR
jgi:DNA-binding MarR family transcriptional regulator